MYCWTDFPQEGIHLAAATAAMWEQPLPMEEEALIQTATTVRQREFRAGRHAAREALRHLGRPTRLLLRDGQRRPVWPEGVVGSITHTSGACLAAVALASRLAGLGVDVEPLEELEPSLQRRIATEAELAGATGCGLPAAKLLFSIKESAYKAFHPRFGIFLRFHEATVELDPANSTFLAHLHPTGSDLHVRVPGRYTADGTHLATLAWLPLE